ncbi:MAG: RluA family pseudouridine synthase [Candidatus Latescibacteria bacterium]|jgi:23S rRNA pseudouridine1911/1915/1917 synthase|nr:RluA family pseudouridine synthase [Candidatus Latescibacterota bacterium]
MNNVKTPDIIHMDNHVMVVRKPAGILVQGDKTGDETLLDQCRLYLKERFNKPGNVFLGLVHRIDRPVSGVMVFARTSKAAGRLVTQFRTREVEKKYWALVQGKVQESALLVDRISRHGPTSHIARNSEGQNAELFYRRLRWQDGISWVEIDLHTGRHHQIRVQFSQRGHAVIGDFRYGSKHKFPERSLALHARKITFEHPVLKEPMTFTAEPEEYWPAAFR